MPEFKEVAYVRFTYNTLICVHAGITFIKFLHNISYSRRRKYECKYGTQWANYFLTPLVFYDFLPPPLWHVLNSSRRGLLVAELMGSDASIS